MSKVFFDVGISLDGVLAGENRGPKNPIGDGGTDIHKWMYKQKAFLSRLKMEGGETNNKDNDLIEQTFNRAGAYIMGKRMFEEGEANWPEDAPFGAPVYVLTHSPREPWVRKGGTTLYFITDGIESALQKAKEVAGSKDVRISGSSGTIQQFLNTGLIDEFAVHLAPVFLGKGIRLFDNIDKNKVSVEIIETINSPLVTHLNYKVAKK